MSLPWRKWWRDILDHPVFIHDPTAWRVFEFLVLSADDDGRCSYGIKQMSKLLEMKRTTIYDAIKRLEDRQMVDRRPNGRFTEFLICNWERWQGDDRTGDRTLAERSPNARRYTYKIKSKSKNNMYPPDFLKFWSTYPRKVGKNKCLKIWEKEKPPLGQCLKTLGWQIKSEQWSKPEFIPHPSTWLNRGQWDDEVELEKNEFKVGKYKA